MGSAGHSHTEPLLPAAYHNDSDCIKTVSSRHEKCIWSQRDFQDGSGVHDLTLEEWLWSVSTASTKRR